MPALQKPESAAIKAGHEIAPEVAIQFLLRDRFIGRAIACGSRG